MFDLFQIVVNLVNFFDVKFFHFVNLNLVRRQFALKSPFSFGGGKYCARRMSKQKIWMRFGRGTSKTFLHYLKENCYEVLKWNYSRGLGFLCDLLSWVQFLMFDYEMFYKPTRCKRYFFLIFFFFNEFFIRNFFRKYKHFSAKKL